MKINTHWQKDLDFTAVTEKGHEFTIKGDGKGVSPMEYLLSSVGGCSSIDIVLILEKARQQISGCDCQLTAERADAVPAVFTTINAHYVITGKNLKPSQVERACQLSVDKYCSVMLMLKSSVEITYSYEIIEQD